MNETCWYWPRENLILIRYVINSNLFGQSIGWSCGDTSIYWSDVLDHTDEFVLLGDL